MSRTASGEKVIQRAQSRRIWAATEATALGRGEKTVVRTVTGLDYKTIQKGEEETNIPPLDQDGPQRIRKAGGGRKKNTDKDPLLAGALDALMEPVTRGDPETPLRWTCKSTPNLAKE